MNKQSQLTSSSRWQRPLLVGALVGSSYALVYPLLHFPFACNWALGLIGVVLILEVRQ